MFYVADMTNFGYHNHPFCNRQKTYCRGLRWYFMTVLKDMPSPKNGEPFCREIMFSKVFNTFSIQVKITEHNCGSTQVTGDTIL